MGKTSFIGLLNRFDAAFWCNRRLIFVHLLRNKSDLIAGLILASVKVVNTSWIFWKSPVNSFRFPFWNCRFGCSMLRYRIRIERRETPCMSITDIAEDKEISRPTMRKYLKGKKPHEYVWRNSARMHYQQWERSDKSKTSINIGGILLGRFWIFFNERVEG